MIQISKILKELRKKNGYTQQDLAEVLKLEVSSYGKKELGQTDITLRQLEFIANFYGVTVLELLAYPNSVSVNNELLQPKIHISVEVGSKNQKDKVIQVLQKIDDINIEILDK